MAENVERMRSLVGSALDGIVSIDTDGRILDLNGAAEELFGCQADQAIGKRLAELFIPPELRERHLAALQRHIDAPQPSMLFRRLEAEAMRADGSRFDAEIAVVRTTWSGRAVYTGFVRDVTQLRHAAEREREQAAHVAGLEQAKTQLLNLASHELRGPLGILNGYLAMIEEGALGDLPTDLAQVVPLLRSKVTEMNSLVDGMLDAARIDDEHLRLTTAPTDVRDVVTRAVEQVAAMRRDRRRTRIELPAEPVIVAGDSVRLVQVVGNLVHNALKYSPQGGDVKVSLTVEDTSAVVSVEDHGLGIDGEDFPRLFTRFGRIVNRHNSHIPGTGLGLYLARELARMHSGDITVTSTPRAGSVFVLSLPIAQD
jgi:PAS domain S-box-containing protein